MEQWQDELREKFDLRFELPTRAMIDAEPDGNVFTEHPLLIARMDMLSRNEDLQAQLEANDWGLVVVDEAHRMSAHYFSAELKQTDSNPLSNRRVFTFHRRNCSVFERRRQRM